MERNEIGFNFYVESMARSADDKKKKILPLAKDGLKSLKGDILDAGGGGGNLSLALLDLQKKFGYGLTIVDADTRMMKILRDKFGGQPQVNLILCDILNLNLKKHFSVAVCSSLLHEIFSNKGDINDVEMALECIKRHLLPRGTLIIRDGIKPVSGEEIIFLKPLRPKINEKLWKFASSYKYLRVAPVQMQIDGHEVVAITRELAYEFSVKYRYPEVNWPAEMKEQFGFWTENDACRILKKTGFEIVYLKKYLLGYFKQLFSKDFLLFGRKNEKLVKLDYLDTHLVIAAKRT